MRFGTVRGALRPFFNITKVKNMAYKKTEPKANFAQIEHEVLDFWRSDDTFHKSLEKTKMGEPFNFYDGPPFANGLPHWGHWVYLQLKIWFPGFKQCVVVM